MKTSPAIGIALFAIAAVSRVAAIDLVYSKTTQISPNSAGGHAAYAYDSLSFPPPDPGNGFLAAIIIDYHFVGRASDFEVNVYGFPIKHTPGVSVVVDLTVPWTSYTASDSDRVQGPQVLLGVGKISSVAGPVDLRISTQITNPIPLNQFFAPGASSVNSKVTVIGDTFSGGSGAEGNATTSIKFVFSVPDAGPAFLPLGLSLSGIFAIHSVRQRRRQVG